MPDPTKLLESNFGDLAFLFTRFRAFAVPAEWYRVRVEVNGSKLELCESPNGTVFFCDESGAYAQYIGPAALR